MTFDIAANKRIVEAFLHSAGTGGDILSYLDEDLTWWVPPHWQLSGTYKKAELAALFGSVFALLETLPRFTIHVMTAEADRVAVDCESEARFKDGSLFGNSYHFLFRVRNGKIVAVKEFMNTVRMSRIVTERGLARVDFCDTGPTG